MVRPGEAVKELYPLHRMVLLLAMSTTLLRSADADVWAVPTFESLGLYFKHASDEGACGVRYRASGSTEWREGHPLVYGAREKQYRGSLVGLRPDTEYEIRIEVNKRATDLK